METTQADKVQKTKTVERLSSSEKTPEKPKLSTLKENIQAINQSKQWLNKVISDRVESYTKEKGLSISNIQDLSKTPEFLGESNWAKLKQEHALSNIDMCLLSIVFFSQFEPRLLLPLWKNEKTNFIAGAHKKEKQTQSAPTLRTVIFILCGEDYLQKAIFLCELNKSALFREGIVNRNEEDGVEIEEQRLSINEAYYLYLLNDKKPKLEVSAEFPAILLGTDKTMEDLVLKESVREQLELLMDYVRFKNELYDNSSFSDKVKEGYVAMLYGPPGTGKTMSVSAMGKTLGVDVFCVDLSRVVSKYIGETEKNLEKIFTRLEGKDCILFFDEADSLFGKRTEVKDAKDRYANQEVAYLLQKIERFPGLVILASNYNQNLDKAFRRRILSSVFMAPPAVPERIILWERAIPSNFTYEGEKVVEQLANEFPLTGANIANVMKLACLSAKKDATELLSKKRITKYIKLELEKEKN